MDARVPRPRDRDRRRRRCGDGAVQGGAARRRRAERAARVRRRGPAGRGARRARSKSAGAGARRRGWTSRAELRAWTEPDMRFFLTTAIDYVNSRPHLGTAYEKITADVIARYKRLAGFDTWFLMGNDEHSQNVFRRAQELGKDPLAYCDEMERCSRDVWKRLDVSYDDFIRTTDRAAAHAGRAEDGAGVLRRRRHLRRRLRGLVLRRLRGLQAGEGPRRRAAARSTRRSSRSGFARRTGSSGCRSTSSRCSSTTPRIPSFIEPEVRRNEILRLVEGGPRGHLGEPRRAVVGHSAAVRSAERRLRLVRRADQLRGGGRLRLGRRALRAAGGRPICTSSARTSRASTA